MFDGVAARVRRLWQRACRSPRWAAREARQWLADTRNLSHVAVLVFVPLLVAVVTLLSRNVQTISFLLFPPLASGTFTLFAEPEGRYSSPRRFVGGLTLGALCGWLALEVTARFVLAAPPGQFHVTATAAAFGILLTGITTWAVDLELPTAFSTALLVLVTGTAQFLYVVGVFLTSSLVAAVFVLYRDEVYERRAEFLYSTVGADDHVLVPLRDAGDVPVAAFGAHLAAAHEDGTLVLLATLDSAYLEEEDVTDAAVQAGDDMRDLADRLAAEYDVSCDVAVVDDQGPETVRTAADETGCDLVVAPYDGEGDGALARGLFDTGIDVVAFRSATGRTGWSRPMVAVRDSGEVAHAKLDYAERIADAGPVGVCHCIDRERERRAAEELLATLVETVHAPCETRVSRLPLAEYLERTHDQYDVLFLGASTDRSTASRLLSRPTFERLLDLEVDMAIVHVD